MEQQICDIKSKEKGIQFKIGIEKSYDHVNWDFVLYMLLEWDSGKDGETELKNASHLHPS